MKLSIIGTGYVGLVTGACFADVGNHVVCVDTDASKVALLDAGGIPIHEPGLAEIVDTNRKAGRIRFTQDTASAVAESDVVFIAVGTPPREDGSADLLHVLHAAGAVGRSIAADTVVVVKSTVPVGTCDRVQEVITAELARRRASWRVSVVSNPEFLKEGSAVEDFRRADRIIVGADDVCAVSVMRELYAPFNRHRERLMVMDRRSSELTKYAANAMLATRISLMNELAGLADRLGADIEAVRKGVGADVRIGPSFLYAGVGFGGSCFPKDVRALVRMAVELNQPAQILRSVQLVNDRQKHVLSHKIAAFFDGELRGKRIAVWGLAFKPNTDDVREAPSLTLIRDLLSAGAQVQAYDPVAGANALLALQGTAGLSRLRVVDSSLQACEGADVLAVVTEWLEFRSPDLRWLAANLAHRAVFDGRNLYEAERLAAHGLRHFGIGRSPLSFVQAAPEQGFVAAADAESAV
jgi:UDPglucose 6-dehydrogenase